MRWKKAMMGVMLWGVGCNLSDSDLSLSTRVEYGVDMGSDAGAPWQEPDAAPVSPESSVCGDGVVEGDERCDGDCPQDAAQDCIPEGSDACFVAAITGSSGRCNALCELTLVKACVSGDGCCPAACTEFEDSDCARSRRDFGESCQETSDCGSRGACVGAGEQGEGLCSAPCTGDGECDPQEVCTTMVDGQGSCAVQCALEEGCAQGTLCVSFSHVYGAQRICLSAALVPTRVGAPCESGAECLDGEQCITHASNQGYTNGYCTALCDPRPCPGAAICHALDVSNPQATSFCYASCQQDQDCRTDQGYTCQPVPEGGAACMPVI